MLIFIKLFFQYCLPQKLLTCFMGFLASNKHPLIKNTFIKVFYALYDIDMSEAVEEEILNYPSFHDFFIRRLKENARPIDDGESCIVSSADGKISQLGYLQSNRLIQAKGKSYTLEDLLAKDERLTAAFKNGAFITTYLAPNNYHRVHMPMAGTLVKMIYVPGKLFSVSPFTAEHVPNLFARNERVICVFETKVGLMAVILVGAMIVGSISTVWAGTITPPRNHDVYSVDYSNDTIALEKGEELGYFSLGSTTIVLFEKDRVRWDQSIHELSAVKMGQNLAEFSNSHLNDQE